MAGDVHIAVVPFQGPAATGNVTVHADGTGGKKSLGGRTPKAVIVVCASTSLLDTDVINGSFSIGWAVNGGNTQAHDINVFDAVTSTTNNRKTRDNRVLELLNSSFTVLLAASVTSWDANGVTLNFDVVNAAAQNRQCYAILIAGNDVEAACGIQNIGTGTNSTFDITAPGFEPDLVFLGGVMNATNPQTSASNAIQTLGVSLQSGVHRAMYWGEANAVAAGGQPRAALHDDASHALYNVTTGALIVSAVANTFDSQGFTIALTGTGGSQRMGWFALKLDGVGISLFDFVTKTTTGTQAYTTPGFEPQFVMLAGTSQTVKNAVASDVADAASQGYSAFDSNMQRAYSMRSDPAADPTDVSQAMSNKSLALGSTSTSVATLADLDSLDATGFTLDYTTVDGSARNFWALAIEIPTPPTYASRRFFL